MNPQSRKTKPFTTYRSISFRLILALLLLFMEAHSLPLLFAIEPGLEPAPTPETAPIIRPSYAERRRLREQARSNEMIDPSTNWWLGNPLTEATFSEPTSSLGNLPAQEHLSLQVVSPEDPTSSSERTSRGLRISYDTRSLYWGGGGLTYDDLQTDFQVESKNLRELGVSEIYFSARGDTDQIKVELVDAQDKKTAFQILGIRSDQEAPFRLSLEDIQDINLTLFRSIYFIVEGNNKNGNLEINFIPEIYPKTEIPTNAVAYLPEFPFGTPGYPSFPVAARVAPAENGSAIAGEENGVTLYYDTYLGGWAGAGFTYDDYGTEETETVDLSSYETLSFLMEGNSGPVKLELVDYTERKSSVILSGIQEDHLQTWTVKLTDFHYLDLEQIKTIFFIIESPNQTGVLRVLSRPESFLPLLPEGWTRTPSNPNFAFQTVSHPFEDFSGADFTLHLLNLLTGENRILIETSINGPEEFTESTDVSPDGRFVIFETEWFPAYRRIRIQDLENPSQTTLLVEDSFEFPVIESVEYKQDSIQFTTKITDIPDPIFGEEGRLKKTYQFDYLSREIHLLGASLEKTGDGVTANEESSLVLFSPGFTTHSRLEIYEQTNSPYPLTLLRSVPFSLSSIQGTFPSLTDFYRLSNEHRIVTAVMGEETLIVDADSDSILRLEGKAVSVQHEGNIARYSVQFPDGTFKEVRVNIETFLIISELPPGFTVTASNPNFAYRIDHEWVNSHWDRDSLNLLNLETGEIRILESSVHPSYEPSLIGPVIDVSPNGQYATYEKLGTFDPYGMTSLLTILDLENSERKLEISRAGNGFGLEAIQFSESTVTLTSLMGQGDPLRRFYTISLNSFQIDHIRTTIANLDSSLFIDDSAHLVVHSPLFPKAGEVLTIFDSSAGYQNLKVLQEITLPNLGPIEYTLRSATRFRGQRIFSIAFHYLWQDPLEGYDETWIINAENGKRKTLKGAAIKVSYSGSQARYELKRSDGTIYFKNIRLKNLL